MPEPTPPREDVDLFRYLEAHVSQPIKLLLAIVALGSVLTSGFLAADNLYVRKGVFDRHEKTVAVRLDRSDLRGVESERTIVTGQIFQLERERTLSSAEVAFLNQLRNRQAQIEHDIAELRTRLLAEEARL